MPTLLRFFVVLALLFGALYSTLYAFAHFVEPTPRDMSETVPPEKLKLRW